MNHTEGAARLLSLMGGGRMRAGIALLLGWAIGFGGPVIAPQISWAIWVSIGSAAAFFVMLGNES